MSYLHDTPANVAHLAAKTGMPEATAKAWLRCEAQSVNNPTNPLNIRYYGSTGQHLGPGATGKAGVGFARYDSAFEGLNAAAWLLLNLPAYAGVRSAIHAGGANRVAMAIEASPWAAGHYGGGSGRQGCIARQIPDVPTTPVAGMPLTVHDRTPVYDHPGGPVVSHVSSGTYSVHRSTADGAIWYHVQTGNLAGKWLPAEPWMTVHTS